MKKWIIMSCFFFLLCIPTIVVAEEEEEPLQAMNLEGLLKDEEIEADLSNYEETDEQAVIYLFRGHGCNHCYDFAEFLASIVEEYGTYFKVISFEIWYDDRNAELLSKAAKFVNKKEAVPLIIIGNQSFSGFGVDTESDIKEAIMKEYESTTKYDVLVEMSKVKSTISIPSLLLHVGACILLVGVVVSYLSVKRK